MGIYFSSSQRALIKVETGIRRAQKHSFIYKGVYNVKGLNLSHHSYLR